MPFPYAYYKEYYNGPVNAESLKGKALFITSPVSSTTTGGDLDVAGVSHIYVDAVASNIVIDRLVGSADGQVLFIYKTSENNSLTIKHNSSGSHKVMMANKQDLVLGNSLFGGAIFICRDIGGVLTWFQLDSNGFYGDGSQALPSITFASDPDTGFYHKSANTMAASTDGLDRLIIGNAFIASMLPYRFADGSIAAPSISFNSDPDTGFYKTEEAIIFSADAAIKLALRKNGELVMANPILKAETPFQLSTDADVPQQLYVGGLLSSDDNADAVNIPVDGIYSKGNIKTAGLFEGTATSAQFADLAERYEADAIYAVGTLVSIGGDKEITQTIGFADSEVFGIISTAPAFAMNNKVPEGIDERLHPFVALAGRVPCRVTGKVKKGERIISSSRPGVGQGLNSAMLSIKDTELPFVIVGRALENKDTDGEGLIEVAIGGLK